MLLTGGPSPGGEHLDGIATLRSIVHLIRERLRREFVTVGQEPVLADRAGLAAGQGPTARRSVTSETVQFSSASTDLPGLPHR